MTYSNEKGAVSIANAVHVLVVAVNGASFCANSSKVIMKHVR